MSVTYFYISIFIFITKITFLLLKSILGLFYILFLKVIKLNISALQNNLLIIL